MASGAPILRLYGVHVSQPTRAVQWLLEMTKTPYVFEERKPYELKDDREFYLKFPAGTLPAIEEEESTHRMTEGNAIMQYLALSRGWSQWYPQNNASASDKELLRRRAIVDQWLHWHHGALRPCTAHFFRPVLCALLQANGLVTPGEHPFYGRVFDAPAEFTAGRAILKDSFLTMKFGAFVDGRTQQPKPGSGGFLVAPAAASTTDHPTLADVAAYCELDQLEAMGVLDALGPNVVPREVVAWMARMKTLPMHDEVRVPMHKLFAWVKKTDAAKEKLESGLSALRKMQ
eukprot:PhM_4_TR16085/c1_g1_i5/m.38442/K00799/GST, gst; glutathione S-transferase